jgi:hypothetical protein
MTPLEFFHASAPAVAPPSTTEVLTELGSRTAEQALLAAPVPEEPDGVRLVHEVLRRSATTLGSALDTRAR